MDYKGRFVINAYNISIYVFRMDLNKHEVDVHYYMSYSDAFFH